MFDFQPLMKLNILLQSITANTSFGFMTAMVILAIALAAACAYIFILLRKYKKAQADNAELRSALNNKSVKQNSEDINELKNINKAKDKFFSIVAHDLKNPISSIKILSEVIEEDSKNLGDTQIMEMAKAMSMSVDCLLKLLENLLSWSRTQLGTIKFEPAEISVKEMAQQVESYVKTICDAKNITLKTSISGSETIYCDNNMIQSVLRNMITNAVKFSYPDSCIRLSFNSDDENSILAVSDDGTGMSAEIASTLFKIDKYITTTGTKRETGTGLGLLLCDEFVRKHNGQINVETQEGLGTTFTITIPRRK